MRKINTDLAEYIYPYSITSLIDKIDEVKENSEVSWNSYGGSTVAGQRFIDFLNGNENELTANVSGIAASMGAVILPFFNKVIGSKQADIMLHSVTGGAKSTRANTNQFLYEALAKKINEVKFKEITGKELKTVMLAEDDDRVDIWLTGKQAGYIGLFDETYDLLDKAASLDGKIDTKELDYELPKNIAKKYGLIKENKLNKNDMDIKDVTANGLKTGNLEVYNSIIETGKKAEQARVAKITPYIKYDEEKANSIIKSGENLSVEDVEHFMEKKFNKTKIDNLENGSEENFDPAKQTKSEKENLTPEQKEKEAGMERVRQAAGSDIETETKK